MTKKITKATIKAFIRKNQDKLHVRAISSFSGMSDMVESLNDDGFTPAVFEDRNEAHTLGVVGLWLVGGSRNSFTAIEREGWIGFNIWNCCGETEIAIRA